MAEPCGRTRGVVQNELQAEPPSEGLAEGENFKFTGGGPFRGAGGGRIAGGAPFRRDSFTNLTTPFK